MVGRRLEGAFAVNAISYVLVLVGFSMSFILAGDITKKNPHLTSDPQVSIFYTFLCLTSAIGLIYIDVYLELKKRQHTPEARHMETLRASYIRKQSVMHINTITPMDATHTRDMTSAPTPDVVDGYYTNVSKGINFYFLLGGILFGVGAVILDVVTLYSITINIDCDGHIHRTVVISSHLFLTITEMVFVMRRHKTVIVKSNAKCRFILVHVVATNLCIWFLLVVGEALEFYHDEIEIEIKEHNSTHTDCESKVRVVAAVYLVPCIIEHSLFVIPVVHTMYHKMTNTEVTLVSKRTARSWAKVWLMIKRVHVGFIVFVATMACESVYIWLHTSFSEQESDNTSIKHESERRSHLLYFGTQITLVSLANVALIIAFRQFSKLGFDASIPTSFDEHLLFISMGGYIFYNVSRLLPSIAGLRQYLSELWDYPDVDSERGTLSVLMLLSTIGAIMHGLLQTTFISVGMRSYAVTPEQARKKPGRSVIGFLVVANLSLWLTVTLDIRKSTVIVVYSEYYGQVPWLLLTFSVIPLVIFYLFHSTVCFSDVWKEAYEKDEVQE